MDQKKFLEILKKYRLGNASPEEKKLIDEWFDAMGSDSEPLHDLHEAGLKETYWQNISSALTEEHRLGNSPRPVQSGFHRTRIVRYSLGVAASFAIIFLSLFYLNKIVTPNHTSVIVPKELEEKLVEWKQMVNEDVSPQRFVLSDGSSITLESQSRIRVSPDFNSNGRHLYLEGQAFFEVAHNKAQPFVVHTDGVVTKVLGTSFTVKAFQNDKDVVVSVKTGKVSVYDKHGKAIARSLIILKPNQQIIYDREKQSVVRSIVDIPVPIVEQEVIRRMRFEDAPVEEIFDAIEEAYGIEIEFDEDQFSSCTLTTLVSGGDLYNRLDIITQAIGASYEVKEDRIVISGSGCN